MNRIEKGEMSRRERQIMDILYNKGEATVREIQEQLPDPPTPMAIRGALKILDDKALLSRRKNGREVVYRPRQSKNRGGSSALRHVLETFFDGSVEKALSTHFADRKSKITKDEFDQLKRLIEEAKEKGQ